MCPGVTIHVNEEAYLGPFQTFMKKSFTKIVNG